MESKHGHWIPVDRDCRDYTDEYDCSVCEGTVRLAYFTTYCDYEYCPWCGSKMDEEDADARD